MHYDVLILFQHPWLPSPPPCAHILASSSCLCMFDVSFVSEPTARRLSRYSALNGENLPTFPGIYAFVEHLSPSILNKNPRGFFLDTAFGKNQVKKISVANTISLTGREGARRDFSRISPKSTVISFLYRYMYDHMNIHVL